METTYLLDQYVTTKAGDPYRLFPFGVIYKGGHKREITPEIAAQFTLPHFKAPIKLGSHGETTPAGGHILALEVRADGLYCVPEFTTKGLKAVEDGDYRYHSPEVIWEGGYEDPKTGDLIPGPLIVGDALLHTPHLGEAAALYSVEINSNPGGQIMDEVTIPKSLFEKFTAWIDSLTAKPVPAPEPAPEPTPEPVTPPAVVELEKFNAVQAELDQFKAEKAQLEADKARAELLGAITADLKDADKYGSMYVEVKAVDEAAGMLATMTPEQREWCMRNFSAHAAQIKAGNLTAEIGSTGEGVKDARVALDAAIHAVMDEKHVDYNAAFAEVRATKPELLK